MPQNAMMPIARTQYHTTFSLTDVPFRSCTCGILSGRPSSGTKFCCSKMYPLTLPSFKALKYRSVRKSIDQPFFSSTLNSIASPNPFLSSYISPIREITTKLTSQPPTLLQMIDPFPVVTFPQLLPDQPRHHTFDPLFADNGILSGFQGGGVVVIDILERGRDGGFGGEEGGGFGSGHCRGAGGVIKARSGRLNGVMFGRRGKLKPCMIV